MSLLTAINNNDLDGVSNLLQGGETITRQHMHQALHNISVDYYDNALSIFRLLMAAGGDDVLKGRDPFERNFAVEIIGGEEELARCKEEWLGPCPGSHTKSAAKK